VGLNVPGRTQRGDGKATGIEPAAVGVSGAVTLLRTALHG
jgi:hypothetical protein